MTVPTYAISSYDTNNSTTDFVFTFEHFSTSEIDVQLVTISTGVSTTLVLTTDYTISSTGSGPFTGGTLSTTTTYDTGFRLVISRISDQIQNASLTESGQLPAQTLEDRYDKNVMMIQEDHNLGLRGLHVPISDTIADMEIPNEIDRAGKALTFDANGNPTVTDGTSATATNAIWANLVTKRPLVDVRYFGATGAGVTDDYDAINEAAIHAAATGRPLYFPAGTYILGTKLTISTSNAMTILGDGSSNSVLKWTSATDGIDISFSQNTVPPKIQGLTLKNSDLGNGTALKLQYTDPANSMVGPDISDVAIRGDDINNHTWDVGIHLLNCYGVSITDCSLKGTNVNEPNYDGTSAIIMESSTLTQIDRVLISHWVNGIIQSGSSAGEGVYIYGVEITFITNGIVLTRGKAANIIADMHINAAEVCISWTNTLQGSIHNCILYQQAGTAAWVGIYLETVKDIHVHNNFIQSVSTPSSTAGIQLRGSAKQCHISHNQFWNVTTAGVGISLGTNTDECIIENNQGLVNITDVVGVGIDAGHSNTIRNNWPHKEYDNALGNVMTYEGETMVYEDEILYT